MRSLLIIPALGALGLGGAALRPPDAPAAPAAPAARPAAAPAAESHFEGIFTTCVPPAERHLSLPQVPMARRRVLAACVIRLLAPRMNEGLPARIDPITTLVAVRGEERTMTYRYRLDLAAADIDSAMRADVAARVRDDVCAAGAMRSVFAFGGQMRFDYVDRLGSPVMAVDIPSC